LADLAERLRVPLAGRYRIEREQGRGGMATVFLAEDLKHHRPVAIKVLDPDLAAVIGPKRFLREIEVAARLQHPHILPLLDSGDADGLLYYVMPYVAGESLRTRLDRERQLPVEDALQLGGEVASALDYAHRHGVVHRDIKPENILLGDGQAVVADFGIARAIATAGGAKLTTTGASLGTPLYMSPEQAMGSDELDGRSDLYSLACVLYEMLSGQPPFIGSTAESLVHQHLSVEPRPVTLLRTIVPQHVDRALAKSLAKAAADRFGTASEFAAALAPRSATGAVAAEPRPAKPARPRARALAVAVAIAVVAFTAFAASQRLGPFARWLGGSSSAHAANKEWILVAEFEGPPDDSTLAIATRDLVSAALDQSAIVATVPREQIRLALERAGKPTNTRVDAELAKELAYRSAVRAVVEGKIGRLGRGFSVVLRVVDAESLKVVLTERAAAMNQDALIPTLGKLAEIRPLIAEARMALASAEGMAKSARR
jgi:serine/threonine-protein kinase